MRFQAILGFYGMSEIGTIARSFSPTSLGIVTPGVEVKIVDPLTGELQGPNQIGEILAKNATMMKGYLKREEETKKFFTDDGFARTGDLG
jgi:long-subunit acyl-CoA synthetase (AMP-forming)